jgi:hypothetical protein
MRRFQGMHLRALASATLTAVVSLSCGSGPGTPTPSPSATQEPGGPVTGRYAAQITPSPACALARAPLTFPMQAVAAGVAPHPGVQVLLLGDGSRFELELLSTATALRGGVGTTEEGVLANEGMRVWVRGIASGSVFRAADGRGQVTSGTMAGSVALATANGSEGDLGTCSATDHAFSLRAQ